MAFRHRHCRLSSLIELAEVEAGKAETAERKKQCEENEGAIRHKDCSCSRWFLVPLCLCPAERQ